MKTIFEHIEHMKGKPHHVRKRVAFVTAACGTAVIALVWLVGSLGTGAFAIRGATFAESTGAEPAAATAAAVESADVPAHIEIIDASSPAFKAKQTEQTTIPF